MYKAMCFICTSKTCLTLNNFHHIYLKLIMILLIKMNFNNLSLLTLLCYGNYIRRSVSQGNLYKAIEF